jgi:hypothetical protein
MTNRGIRPPGQIDRRRLAPAGGFTQFRLVARGLRDRPPSDAHRLESMLARERGGHGGQTLGQPPFRAAAAPGAMPSRLARRPPGPQHVAGPSTMAGGVEPRLRRVANPSAAASRR